MDDAIKLDGHKLAYHPLEVARWLTANESWETAKSIYPLYVEISPFGGCNFRCTFCAKDFLKYENNKIPLDVMRRMLETMARKGVKSVYFAGEGEPLLYDELGDVFDHCRSVGLDSALNTNGSTSNRKALRSAVANCEWIRFSVNAGSREAHTRIHNCRDGTFERVLSNLEFCVSVKKELRSRCVLGAQAVLVDENKDSLVELARRCREIGIDYLTVKPYSQHPESLTRKHEGTDYADVRELAARLQAEQSETFKVYCRLGSFERAKEGALRYSKCHSVPFFWAYVRANGDVFGCSNFMTDSRFHYGNVNQAGFDEIWEGPGRQAAFEYMMNAHDISRCRINCRMDKVNEYLWELKNPAPHVNFI